MTADDDLLEPTEVDLLDWAAMRSVGRRKFRRVAFWLTRYRNRVQEVEGEYDNALRSVFAAEAAARSAESRLEVAAAMNGFRLATRRQWVSDLRAGDVGKLYGVKDTSPYNATPKGGPFVLYQVDESDVGVMFAHPITGALYHSNPGTAVWLLEPVYVDPSGEQAAPTAGQYPERPLLQAAPFEASDDGTRAAAAASALANPQTWQHD